VICPSGCFAAEATQFVEGGLVKRDPPFSGFKEMADSAFPEHIAGQITMGFTGELYL
jgi:hypothetical protein